jgi:hypothetical protein
VIKTLSKPTFDDAAAGIYSLARFEQMGDYANE